MILSKGQLEIYVRFAEGPQAGAPDLVTDIPGYGLWQALQPFSEGADSLSFGFGGQAGVSGWWRVVLPPLQQLDHSSNDAAALLLQIIDLHRHFPLNIL